MDQSKRRENTSGSATGKRLYHSCNSWFVPNFSMLRIIHAESTVPSSEPNSVSLHAVFFVVSRKTTFYKDFKAGNWSLP
jgi:hypothetical protein